jgi:hypothetical protein
MYRPNKNCDMDLVIDDNCVVSPMETIMENYFDCFEDKEDLARQFNIDLKELDGATIIFALYEQPSYEGYALVLFERDGKLYEVNGSHCSCYGLEGQWSPEETSVEELMHRIERGNLGYYTNEYSKTVKQALESYKK